MGRGRASKVMNKIKKDIYGEKKILTGGFCEGSCKKGYRQTRRRAIENTAKLRGRAYKYGIPEVKILEYIDKSNGESESQ